MVREVGVFQAKNELSALLDEVEHGAEMTIARLSAAVAAADRIVARSKGITLGGISIKELVREGRR